MSSQTSASPSARSRSMIATRVRRVLGEDAGQVDGQRRAADAAAGAADGDHLAGTLCSCRRRCAVATAACGPARPGSLPACSGQLRNSLAPLRIACRIRLPSCELLTTRTWQSGCSLRDLATRSRACCGDRRRARSARCRAASARPRRRRTRSASTRPRATRCRCRGAAISGYCASIAGIDDRQSNDIAHG